MTPKFDFKKVYNSSSDRVKCTDIHQTEPWILVCLYDGKINIHNYETQKIIKSFDVGSCPVRIGLFVNRKNWIIVGCDDLIIRIFNYNTLEKVHSFEAHSDYLRYLCVHPTKSLLISCGDDMLIRVWDWDQRWKCIQKLEGHLHYVMQIVINPKDNNQLASASLDKKIKIWQLGTTSIANYTLNGHDKGVNAVDYCHSGDKPYLVSASDDWNIKVWDYQNKTCVHTLSGHSNNVLRAVFHPNLPFIISTSEDGTARVWDLTTFRLQSTLNYGMGRVWTISVRKNSHEIALGFDDGMLFLRVGKESPNCCMDSTGKIFIARQSTICFANVKNISLDVQNEEKLELPYTELGTSEIYPQSVLCSPNGRYISVIGNGEYCVYTTIVLRSKMLGVGDHFAWSNDSNTFCINEGSYLILCKNFKEIKRIKTGYTIEELFGGPLLTVRSLSDIYFYDWNDLSLIIKIDVPASNIYWNSNNTICCICGLSSLHLLRYNYQLVESLMNSNQITEFGVDEAFESIFDLEETVQSGFWISDCFVFTNKNNRLSYLIGDQVFNMYHIEKSYYIIGFLQNMNRLFLVDKESNVVSFSLELQLIEYESAIIRKEYDMAEKILPSIPSHSLNQLSMFLEDQKLFELAIQVTNDLDHKFDLAICMQNVDLSLQFARILDNNLKWRSLAKLSISQLKFDVAVECYIKMKDPAGLFLLAVVLNSSSLLENALQEAIETKNTNLIYLIYYMTGRITESVELFKSSGMNAEATFLAFTHQPSLLNETFEHWQSDLNLSSPKQASQLAHPSKYPNLFPQFNSSQLVDQLKNVNLTSE